MKLRFTHRLAACLLCLAATAALAGCIREDLGGCPSVFTMTVKAYAQAQGETELTDADVRDVVLYVFDQQMRFRQQIQTSLGQNVEVTAPEGEGIHIVAWGNLCGGNQTRPMPAPGDHKNTLMVCLAPDTRATATPCLSPDDLFLGELTIAPGQIQGQKIIPIVRKVGSMTVAVKKLKEYAGFADDDYRIEVRETFNAFDFYGAYTGNKTSYRPAGAFSGGTYSISPFNMVPEAGLFVDIYHGQTLIYTALAATGTLAPIIVEQGKQTDVLIDFTGTVSVSVQTGEWGKIPVIKEY